MSNESKNLGSDCQVVQDMISDYALELLSAGERLTVNQHLRLCSTCRLLAQKERLITGEIQATLGRVVAPEYHRFQAKLPPRPRTAHGPFIRQIRNGQAVLFLLMLLVFTLTLSAQPWLAILDGTPSLPVSATRTISNDETPAPDSLTPYPIPQERLLVLHPIASNQIAPPAPSSAPVPMATAIH